MPENIDQIDSEWIIERVDRAISNLERQEATLFNPLGSERNIAQRFARWLEDEFPDWNIDCEYGQIVNSVNHTAKTKVVEMLLIRQRNGGFRRLTSPQRIKVVPDIIIHHRGRRENLVAIEIKTSNDFEEIEFDKEKLRVYREYEPLRYRYSLFIRFEPMAGEHKIVAEIQLNP